MKRFTQQFNKEAKKITLTAREQEELLARVETYMEYHPLPKTEKESVAHITSPLRVSEPIRFIHIPRNFVVAMTTMTAMFLFVVVPAMAEQSMPGNILHPIKIHVNEEIKGAFLSGEERVAWETSRVERRLAEARRLATLGRLTPEIEARVAESVTKQKNVAREQIAFLESTDGEAATMATMAMTSMFEVQDTLFDSVRPAEDRTTSELSRIIETSREESESQSELAVVSEAKLLAKIEQHATRAYEILLGLEGVIDTSEKENITRRLNDLERLLGDYSGDVVLTEAEKIAGLRTVWSDLQKLISYMNAFNGSVSVDVEQVVPVRLTYDERVQKLRDTQTILAERIQKLSFIVENYPDDIRLEKLQAVLPEITTTITRIDTVSPVDINSVEAAIAEVRDKLQSLEQSVPVEIMVEAENSLREEVDEFENEDPSEEDLINDTEEEITDEDTSVQPNDNDNDNEDEDIVLE